MAFSIPIVEAAWNRAGGKCECRRKSHEHHYVRCNKQLVFDNRGRTGRGCWETHHINSNGPDTLSNCEIICFDCHTNTRSFGS